MGFFKKNFGMNIFEIFMKFREIKKNSDGKTPMIDLIQSIVNIVKEKRANKKK